MAGSEMNSGFRAKNGDLPERCLQAGKGAKPHEFEECPKCLTRCEMKQALARLPNQGLNFYLCRAEIDLNGVPNGIRTRVARMKI